MLDGSAQPFAAAFVARGIRRLATGVPFYAAWEPDGSGLLAHIGSTLTRIEIDPDAIEPIGITPGSFRAPQVFARVSAIG